MERLSFIAIGLIIFGLQQFLASRKKVWLGAIIPSIYVIGVIVFFMINKVPFFSSDIIPFSLFFTIMLGAWITGHESRKKKEKREIDRMKGKDLM